MRPVPVGTGTYRRVASLLIALALVVTGCSGSDGPAPAASETAGPAATPPTPPPPAPRELATDPARIADDLVDDENVLRDPASSDDLLTMAAHRQQAAYRAIGEHPDWEPIIRPKIPQPMVERFDRNVDARRRLEALSTARDSVPAWRVVAPAPADELLGYYREAEAATGVNWNYLAAVNFIETNFGRVAGVSDAGAQGPMQFLPGTFAAFGGGGDINAPRDSIMAAGRYLAANGFAENRDAALFRYNNSDDYVRAVDDYAMAMAADPTAFPAYHRWQVYVHTTMGDVLLPIGYSEATEIPIADYLGRGADTATAVRMSPQSEATLERMLAARNAEPAADPSQRTELLSRQFLGIPYGANTLIGTASVPEELVIDLDGVDCFTYADYVEALKRAGTRDEFIAALTDVRYRDGIVSFSNRKHFFTDWSAVTPELATDVTGSLSPSAVQVGKNLNAKDSGGEYLPGLPVIPRAVTYLPSGSVDANVLSQLRTGDYVGAYAVDGGLDVTHVGVFVNGPDGPVFRNASSLSANSRVVDEPFLGYVQTVPGIVVLRPVV